jgi:hypothetical protein
VALSFLSATANICVQTSEGSLVDIVDVELDRLISRRASQDRRPDPDEQEEIWKASVRIYNEKRRQMSRLEWHAFHCGQAARHRAVLESLIEHHEQAAAKLLDVQQEGDR